MSVLCKLWNPYFYDFCLILPSSLKFMELMLLFKQRKSLVCSKICRRYSRLELVWLFHEELGRREMIWRVRTCHGGPQKSAWTALGFPSLTILLQSICAASAEFLDSSQLFSQGLGVASFSLIPPYLCREKKKEKALFAGKLAISAFWS